MNLRVRMMSILRKMEMMERIVPGRSFIEKDGVTVL
jgi:hypothetical protein